MILPRWMQTGFDRWLEICVFGILGTLGLVLLVNGGWRLAANARDVNASDIDPVLRIIFGVVIVGCVSLRLSHMAAENQMK